MVWSLISDMNTTTTRSSKLSKVVVPSCSSKKTKVNEKKVRFEMEPLVCYGEDRSSGGGVGGSVLVKNGEKNNYNYNNYSEIDNVFDGDRLKVKILMTKEEAARLLSKCSDGGRLEFCDVARELKQIPVNRVNLVSSSSSSPSPSRDGNYCNFVRRQGIIDRKQI